MQGPFGTDLIVEPDVMGKLAAAYPVAGLWAFEAARIAAHVPRPGLDTDHRTLPHEIGLIETAVHLNKGCYRGQETVARIQNVGRPPRRLVFLHLDGSVDRLPAHGAPITLRTAPRSGSSARRPGTTSSGRSGSGWSSGPCRPTPRCWRTGWRPPRK